MKISTPGDWWRTYRELQVFRDQHGHLNVPTGVGADAVTRRLARFVAISRAAGEQCTLRADRHAALDALGFPWGPWHRKWPAAYDAATTYHRKHRHLLVEPGHTTSDGLALGDWIRKCRQDRRRGLLSTERIAELDAIDMIWNIPLARWQEGMAAAKAFHAAHGHLRVPEDYRGRGIRGRNTVDLSTWLENRRLDHRCGRLSDARVAALDAVGMDWDPRGNAWQRGLAAATEFHGEHGHLYVPDGGRDGSSDGPGGRDGLDLHTWLEKRRAERRAGRLADHKIAALDALGMDWDPRGNAWRRGLTAAQAFHRQHGNLRITADHRTSGVDLNAWLNKQRTARGNGKLTPEQIAALDALGMDWDPRGNAWRRALATAQRFHAEHGHLFVRAVARQGENTALDTLAGWLHRQRTAAAAGKLDAEQIAALEALGMTWGNPQWERGYLAARAYYDTHHDLVVGANHRQDGMNLYTWLKHQRQRRREGRMPDHEAALLDKIDMPWEDIDLRWARIMEIAHQFRDQHGHLDVPADYPTPDHRFNLHRWTHRMRAAHAAGDLPPQHITDLVNLGLITETAPNTDTGRT